MYDKNLETNAGRARAQAASIAEKEKPRQSPIERQRPFFSNEESIEKNSIFRGLEKIICLCTSEQLLVRQGFFRAAALYCTGNRPMKS